MHKDFFSEVTKQLTRLTPRRTLKAAIIQVAACAILILATGCMSVGYERVEKDGEKVKFSTSSFFTKKQIKDVDYGVTRNGSRRFRLKGYANDQTEVISAAVSAALQAYIASQPATKPVQVVPP